MSEVVRYLRIALQFARVGVVRKAQFRLEFVNQVVMDCLWYATHVGVFEILFMHADAIAGWTLPQMRVFLGFLFVSDAFMMMWLGQQWWFGRDLKNGNLDPVRVRPASPIFLYFFQQFSLEALVNMAFAAGYLVYGLWGAGVEPTPVRALCVAWGVLLCWFARWVITVLFTTWEFYLLNSDLARTLDAFFHAAGDRPLDIFSRRVQLFLLHVVPVGMLTHAPASLALGKITLLDGLLKTAWLVCLGWLAVRIWMRSLRRYESAMG